MIAYRPRDEEREDDDDGYDQVAYEVQMTASFIGMSHDSITSVGRQQQGGP